MFHLVMARALARRIYKLKQKLENHMAHYYNYMENVSHHIGNNSGKDYYINQIMKL